MRPVEAADYVLELDEANEFKSLTRKTIELKEEIEEIESRAKAIRNEIRTLNKPILPILQSAGEDEVKRITKRVINLTEELEEIKAREIAIRDEIRMMNKARWPLLQKLYRIVNLKFDYFGFDELKNILW